MRVRLTDGPWRTFSGRWSNEPVELDETVLAMTVPEVLDELDALEAEGTWEPYGFLHTEVQCVLYESTIGYALGCETMADVRERFAGVTGTVNDAWEVPSFAEIVEDPSLDNGMLGWAGDLAEVLVDSRRAVRGEAA